MRTPERSLTGGPGEVSLFSDSRFCSRVDNNIMICQTSSGALGTGLAGYTTGAEHHSSPPPSSSASGYPSGYANTSAFAGHQAYAVAPHAQNMMQPAGHPHQSEQTSVNMNRTTRSVPHSQSLPPNIGHDHIQGYPSAHDYQLDQHALNTNWPPSQYPQSVPRGYTPGITNHSV